MKLIFVKAYLRLVLLLFLMPFQCFAQNEVTLELGSVTVWLGMPRQEAVKQLSKASYTLLNSRSEDFLIPVVDGSRNAVGLVRFTSDRLSYASRSWGTCERDCLETVLTVLGQVAKTPGVCSVENDPRASPDLTVNRILVKCGQHGILMLKGKYLGKETADVEEFIRAKP